MTQADRWWVSTARGAPFPKLGDGHQKPAPMADGGNAESLKIFCGQITQYFGADVILAKCRLVAFKTQFRSQLATSTAVSSGSVTLGAEYCSDGSRVSRNSRFARRN